MAKNVKIAIIGDASGLKGAVRESEGVLSGFSDKLKGFGAGLAAAFTFDKIAGFTKDAIGAASDLNEALSKNNVVYGEGARAISEAAKGSAKSVGLSQKAYQELAGTVGVLGKSAGLAGNDLAAFGNEAIKRAADIGSFNNAATSDVIEAWGAAMRGEMEPMRKFGVLLDDNALRAQALSMGLVDNVKQALTPQQKALAANALIMKQTSDAAGDFARTSDGLANKQRILGAQFDDLKTKVGQKLLPVFQSFVGWLSDKALPAVEGFWAKIQPAFAAAVAWVQQNWPKVQAAIAAVFSWLAQNVPPVVQAVVSAVVAAFQWVRDNVVPIVEKVVGYLIEQFGHAVAWVQQFWPSISEAIGHVANVIADIIGWLVDVVTRVWKMWGDDLLGIVKAIWGTIAEVVNAAVDTIRNIIKFVVDLINGDWDKAWNDLVGIFRGVWDQIFGLLRGAAKIVAEVAQMVWSPIKDALQNTWDWIKNVFSGVADAITWPFRTAFNAIARLWNGTIGKLSFSIPDWVPEIGGKGFSMPKIPELADGGIVNRPTLALIGEAGPEAVVPLRRNNAGGMGGGSVTFNISSTDPAGTLDVLQRAVRTHGQDAVKRVLGIAA